MIDLKKLFKSFGFAFNGIKLLLKEQQNARIHLVATFSVLVLSYFFKLKTQEWIAIILAIAIVFAAEAFNTAIEKLSDFYTKEYNPDIKIIKDIAAAAVLISAISAALIGFIIFIPKIYIFFK